MTNMIRIAALAFFGMVSAAHAGDALQAFPPPEKGMVRHVLQLPEQDDEAALKVELIVGKTVLLDEQNRYFFSGKILKEDVKGWGYTRYIVSALGPMAGTRMAIDPDAPQVNRFVTLGGEPCLIRYNSRLPVVVYAPEGVDVRFRIWSAQPEVSPIEKG